MHPSHPCRPMDGSLKIGYRYALAACLHTTINLPADPARCSGTYGRPAGGRRRAVAQPTSSPHSDFRMHISGGFVIFRILPRSWKHNHFAFLASNTLRTKYSNYLFSSSYVLLLLPYPSIHGKWVDSIAADHGRVGLGSREWKVRPSSPIPYPQDEVPPGLPVESFL